MFEAAGKTPASDDFDAFTIHEHVEQARTESARHGHSQAVAI
jgi:hypothetical protein